MITSATRLAAVILALAAAAGCSSGPSGSTAPSTTGRTPVTGPVTTTAMQVPDTLADGAFPSVLDPKRDRSLDEVRVTTTVVARADSPMALVARPGHDGQLFLAERAGRVRLVTVDPDDRSLDVHPGALVDLSDRISTDGETGLLGLAFSPDGSRLYLSYNVANHDSRVDTATVTDTDTGAGPKVGTPTKLFGVDQMGTEFHKGGNLAVDADGLLYAGFGDGGPQDDAEQHAQDPNLLLGKILRIDSEHPSGGRPYGIPTTNPYAKGGGAPEIWLTGLRNPWRFSIDADGGDLWIGDVGQNEIEEIDRLPMAAIPGGANLGWSGHEGTTVFAADRIVAGSIPPIFEMRHSSGVCSVTGGVVYRGEAIPALRGTYLFSDLCRAGIHGLRSTTPPDAVGTVTDERVLSGAADPAQIISFATDAHHEVYTLSINGEIRRLDPVG